jgi:hypothetical protein
MRAKQHEKAKSEAKDVPGKMALAFLLEEINALEKQLKTCKRHKSQEEES